MLKHKVGLSLLIQNVKVVKHMKIKKIFELWKSYDHKIWKSVKSMCETHTGYVCFGTFFMSPMYIETCKMFFL